MPRYEVYFEGTLYVESDEVLDEDEIFDKAGDILESDARVRLNADCGVTSFEVLSVDDDYE